MKIANLIQLARKDYSTWSLIAVNLFIIVLSQLESWDTSTVLFSYWVQSIIIGVFTFVKIIDLNRFTTEGMRSNGKPVPETFKGKIETALFFLFHYGFFHFGYYLFLIQEHNDVSWTHLSQASILFFLNHLFSYLANRPSDQKKTMNLGTVMLAPYKRIIPMHIIIIIGAALSGSALLILFLLIKTIGDVYGHLIEHSTASGNSSDKQSTYRSGDSGIIAD